MAPAEIGFGLQSN